MIGKVIEGEVSEAVEKNMEALGIRSRGENSQ